MEAPKYYELSNDETYCVHFANKHGLSIEQIKEIFSEWGNVRAVTKAGDEYGYRFVRYRHKEEVERCVEALRNHSWIRLLKPRPASGQQNNGQRNKQGLDNNNNSHQENSSPWGSRIFDVNRRRIGDSRQDNDVPAVAENSAVNFGRSEDVANAGGDATSVPERSLVSQRQKSPFKSNPEEAISALKSKDVPTRPGGSFLPSGPQEDMDNIPDLIPVTVNSYDQNGEGAFPKKPAAKTQWEKDKVVVAEQVVVANVPTDFSENLVLHLLRKHEPISISPMKLATHPAIRYCVVFFASLQQARAVVSEFDTLTFAGQNLIVLRP